jgi:hypothetical protein
VIEGRVSKLEGACPTLTFDVDRYEVRTTAQTRFSSGNCSDIKDKVKVEVRGVETSKRVVAASSITLQDKGDDDGKKAVP